MFVITGCNHSLTITTPASLGHSENSQIIQVAVSILPQADFVKKIGRDKVQVTVMIPEKANPATYEPKSSQLRDLSRTQLYIKVGHIPFEKAWMPRIIAANPQMKIIDSSEGIEIKGKDPHIWLAPSLVKIQLEHICKGLIELDPENKDYYTRNKNDFIKELNLLDQEIKKDLEKLSSRKFMVYHPCWGYFAEEYGLEQISIENEGKEPSSEELINLVKKAKLNNIRVIFVSPQVNPKSVTVIASEIDGKVVLLDPLARDYLTNMRVVSKNIAQALK